MGNGKKIFLIVCPDHEDRVFYCSEWSKEIIKEAKSKGIKVKELKGKNANKKTFEGFVTKQKPSFVMFNGHGLPEVILGQDDEILLKLDENEELMKKKIVYARSCEALVKLGDACVQAGSRVFVGYRIPFAFVSDTSTETRPLKDELAEPCMTTSNIVPVSIIRGKTIEDAVSKAKIEMRKEMEKWETRHDRVEAPFVAMCLYWNSLALGYSGDNKATF